MTQATQTIPAGLPAETKVKESYKQTEIGVIPVDWCVEKLKDLSQVQTGSTPPTHDKSNYGNDYLFVSPADLGESTYIFNTEKKLSKKGFLLSRRFPKNSTLFTCIGSTIGKTGIAGVDLASNQQINAFFPSEKINWLYSYLILTYLSPKIKILAGEQAVPQINKTQFENTQIFFPNDPKEQTAIAAALSDADALIEKLEKLIAKKKAIKQGVMQQLLTGKKRLPRFSGEWVRKKIGDIGEITGSGVDKKTSPDELPVRLVNFLNVYHQSFIYSKDLNHLVTARPEQITRCSVKKGDVFFTPSSEMPYDVGLSAIAMEDMPDVVYSYHVDRMRLFEDWDLLFRAYIFQTKDFSDQAATQCEGSGKRYVLNLTTFRERLTVYYPTYKKEQTAIATVLSDMDTEIEKLEKKLNKYRQIKTGMMQQLLTGKIRLIDK